MSYIYTGGLYPREERAVNTNHAVDLNLIRSSNNTLEVLVTSKVVNTLTGDFREFSEGQISLIAAVVICFTIEKLDSIRPLPT